MARRGGAPRPFLWGPHLPFATEREAFAPRADGRQLKLAHARLAAEACVLFGGAGDECGDCALELETLGLLRRSVVWVVWAVWVVWVVWVLWVLWILWLNAIPRRI